MEIKGTGVCGGLAAAEPWYVEPLREADRDERAAEGAEALKARLDALTGELSARLRADAAALRQKGDAAGAEMLEMQGIMLVDAPFQGGIRAYLDSGYSLTAAVGRAADDQQAAILATGDPYLMERALDVRDMAARLSYAHWGREYPDLSGLERDVVLVAEDLQPSVLVSAPTERVRGMVLAGSSKTAHIAILAAGRGIPAVVGCGDLGKLPEERERVFVDADRGLVRYGLTAEEQRGAQARMDAWREEQKELEAYRGLECRTADGERVWLYGNIMEAGAADKVNECGGDGVGLFRTEFLYMNRNTLPGEEEQFGVYRAVVRKLGGKSVTIRTLDLGADKQTPALDLGHEENPFLGFRAIRVCLARPDLFRVQLRAILRASALGTVKIMFPMVARMEELDRALALLEECKAELRGEGKAFDEGVKVGIMVEVPSTAILARRYAKKVDFFSIGSNDLTQYTLAADRMNERVAHLYDATDPAVLALIRSAVRAMEEAGEGKMCSLCGEMGADPKALPLLLGLGLRHVSVSPSAILRTKRLLSTLDSGELRAAAEDLLADI